MANWVPRKEQDVVDLCKKWAAVLADSAKISAYGWDAAECAKVLGLINAFLTARGDYEVDDSTAKRIVKDEARAEAIGAMRDFANSSIRFNKKMDDAAKLFMGIGPKDTTLTAHGAPVSQPETAVENTHNHYEHRVRAIHPGRGDHSKPADACRVRYAWQVGGERPVSGGDIKGSTKITRKAAYIVRHSEVDKGKTAYYATAYENDKGDTGKWSPIAEAIIA
jgi:hypothetical protein